MKLYMKGQEKGHRLRQVTA